MRFYCVAISREGIEKSFSVNAVSISHAGKKAEKIARKLDILKRIIICPPDRVGKTNQTVFSTLDDYPLIKVK